MTLEGYFLESRSLETLVLFCSHRRALRPAVTFEGYYLSRLNALILASSRVAGICVGVLVALLLTCLVFPVSGSGKVRVTLL